MNVNVVDYAYVGMFAILGVLFVVVLMLVPSWILRPYHPTKLKKQPYECGVIPRGTSYVQFRIIFFIFALLFVIFDVEVIYLYPWAVALKGLKSVGLGVFALVDMIIFLAILIFGLIYAWRKGVLRWV